MIVPSKRSWVRMLFALRGSSLRTTWPRILFVTGFATIITTLSVHYEVRFPDLTMTPFALVGVALSIFLGFRNNESYDRFWEGRKLWGRMVNVTRSFARQVQTLIIRQPHEESEEVRALHHRMVKLTIAYVHAFRHHLRGTAPEESISEYIEKEEVTRLLTYRNVPIAILQSIGDLVNQAWRKGGISEYHVPILEGSLTEMTGVQGGCERIKSTPLPFTYNVLIHRIVAFYCLSLPFGLLGTTHELTPIVVCFISYAFFGLDAIGDEVEQPFETDDNDLPLESICRTIEIDLLQSIEAEQVPGPIQPQGGVLL